MEILVKSANAADLETLLAFEQGIIEAERPFDVTLKEGKIIYYDLIELINSPNSEVALAFAGNDIIGSGYVKILPAKAYLKVQEYAHLGYMFVKPSFRGRGVNQKIIKYLIDWAKGRNLTEVRLNVYSQNFSAQKAYSKIGFKEHMVEMRLEIKNIQSDSVL